MTAQILKFPMPLTKDQQLAVLIEALDRKLKEREAARATTQTGA